MNTVGPEMVSKVLPILKFHESINTVLLIPVLKHGTYKALMFLLLPLLSLPSKNMHSDYFKCWIFISVVSSVSQVTRFDLEGEDGHGFLSLALQSSKYSVVR